MADSERKQESQVQLSRWRATKNVATWLLVASLVFGAAQLVMAALGREEPRALIPTPVVVVACAWLILQARRRIRLIEPGHSS